MSRTGIWAAVVGMLVICGCSAAPGRRDVTNPDPLVKVPAIKQAVASKDLNAARQLVKDLESDDPAVRFYAIQGLRRFSGEDFGYAFYLDDKQRMPAVQRWQEWLAEQELNHGK